MIERSIIMQAHEVRAVLDGRKAQMRHVVKPQPESSGPIRDFVCGAYHEERDYGYADEEETHRHRSGSGPRAAA